MDSLQVVDNGEKTFLVFHLWRDPKGEVYPVVITKMGDEKSNANSGRLCRLQAGECRMAGHFLLAAADMIDRAQESKGGGS